MSIRALWIISSSHKKGKVVFFRSYQTVERRTRIIEGDHYVSVPDKTRLADVTWEALHLNTEPQEFSERRDGCDIKEQRPVYEVDTEEGKLWPVVILEMKGLLYCALVLGDQGTSPRPSLAGLPGVTAAYCLLTAAAEFLSSLKADISETSTVFADLAVFLSQAAPFGSLIDVNPHTVKAVIQTKPSDTVPSIKQPAWKPIVYKGKPQIHIVVSEYVRAAQYDRKTAPDMCEVYGKLTCKADLEGVTPVFSFDLDTSGQRTQLCSLLVHPNVKKEPLQAKASEYYKLQVAPPVETFVICQYSMDYPPGLPIQGYYQMKGEKQVDVILQLKLSESVKNLFEYCEAQLPFYHRGQIKRFECTPSHGSAALAADRKVLAWNIGNYFPKSLEVQLTATLTFESYNPSQRSAKPEEAFCQGQNSFAKILFKIPDFTHSGARVITKSFELSSGIKPRLTLVHEYISSDYKIWNSHGDVMAGPGVLDIS